MSRGLTEDLGQRLARALKERGLTQDAIARRIGASQAAVSHWCNGNKEPTDANLEAVAKTLGINREWLQHGVGPMLSIDLEAQRVEYMRNAYWGFRLAPADGGRDFGNANVWSFEPTIEVLVREVLQNALDAVPPGGSHVQVTFRLVELRNGDLRSYLDALKWKDLRRHLDASVRNKQKLGSLLRDGLATLDESQELMLLIAEDTGTTGLLGPETGEGKFAALCRNNLDSNKEGATTKGGAFGLGKAVLWRASRLATVTFCSTLNQPTPEGHRNLRILGRCDLPWHEVAGQDYAGPSWFGRPDNQAKFAVSFWDNEALARDLYLYRGEIGSGTSACVVGFHDPSSDKPKAARELATEIENAAAAHFFPAIAKGRLSVSVKVYPNRGAYDADSPSTSADVDVRQLQPEYWQMLRAYEDRVFASSLLEPGDVVCRPVSVTVPARRIEPGAIALCWVIWPGGVRGISGTLEVATRRPEDGPSPIYTPRSPVRVPSCPGLDLELLPRLA